MIPHLVVYFSQPKYRKLCQTKLFHDECDRALFFAHDRFVVDENSGIRGRFVAQLSDFPIHADIAFFDLALGLAA